MRQQISRGFLFAALLLLLVSGFLLCFCWQLYLAVSLCSVLSFCFGSRQQRLVAVALFVVAVIVGVVGYQQEQRMFRSLHKAHPNLPAPPNNALQRTAAGGGLFFEFDA